MFAGTLINGGAPSASWRDLAPIIRARSNRVSFGGPMVTTKVSRVSCSSVFCFLRLIFCCVDTLVRGTEGKSEKKHPKYKSQPQDDS